MIALAVAGSYVAILALKRALALRYAGRRRTSRTTELPAATIVQAVLGGDPLLESTLARNVEGLPHAAFLWLVDEDDAAGAEACAAVVRRYAGRQITVMSCPPARANVNPKLFKLELGRAAVGTEAFVVVDDDTVVGAEALDALLAGLESHALTTGLPCYEGGGNLPSRLVAEFVNNNAALTYLTVCALLPPVTINGMCYAVRTSTLHEIGGFAPLYRTLTDDVAVARVVRAHGGAIFQSPYPHHIHTTVPSWGAYASLMHRWFLFARLLIESEGPAVTGVVAAFYVVPPLLLWASLALAVKRPSVWNTGALALLLVLRGGALIDVQRRTVGAARHDWALSIVSELLQPLHALHAVFGKTIRWRSRRIRVNGIDDFTQLT
jgi:ceramide glucosyltransferase